MSIEWQGDRDAASMPSACEAWEAMMGQLPFILFASWWNGAASAMLPPASTHDDAHQQLIVPDPIAVEGEHALFA